LFRACIPKRQNCQKSHNLACGMCHYNDQHKCFEQILVVVDKTFEKHMDDLKHSKTCKIIPVDFRKHHQGQTQEMEKAMEEHKPQWMIMLPTGDTMTREAIKCTLECYKKKGGKNVVMKSLMMAEQATEEPTKMLPELEKCMMECFPKTSCVLRCQMGLECLDYFVEEVKEKKTWRLPLGNGKFSPIAGMDVACALGKICEQQQMDPKCAGKTFNLTNKDKIDGQRLAEMTSTALNMDTKYENMDMNEAQERLRKFIRHDSMTMTHEMHRELTSKAEVCGLMFAFKMVQAGKYDTVTEDLKMIIGKDPMPIEEYLRKNQDRFKGSN